MRVAAGRNERTCISLRRLLDWTLERIKSTANRLPFKKRIVALMWVSSPRGNMHRLQHIGQRRALPKHLAVRRSKSDFISRKQFSNFVPLAMTMRNVCAHEVERLLHTSGHIVLDDKPRIFPGGCRWGCHQTIAYRSEFASSDRTREKNSPAAVDNMRPCRTRTFRSFLPRVLGSCITREPRGVEFYDGCGRLNAWTICQRVIPEVFEIC